MVAAGTLVRKDRKNLAVTVSRTSRIPHCFPLFFIYPSLMENVAITIDLYNTV